MNELVAGNVAADRNPAPARVTAAGCTHEEFVVLAFERHQRELIHFTRRMTRDASAADDIVQEAFLRLVAELAKAGEPTSVRGWLYRVCRNLVVSRARRRDVVERLKRFPGPSGPPAADVETMRHELDTAIQGALAVVPPAARTALLLAADGFSARDIAGTIGRSEGATRALMCRARAHLRVELSQAGAWP